MQAQQRKIPCAVASASKNAPMILTKLGVMDLFAHIVDPATLTHSKPHPEFLLKRLKVFT